MKLLWKEGFWCVKAYASKGAADIYAFKKVNNKTVLWLIQVKKKNVLECLSHKEIEGLRERERKTGGIPMVAFKLSYYGRIQFLEMDIYNSSIRELNKEKKLIESKLKKEKAKWH